MLSDRDMYWVNLLGGLVPASVTISRDQEILDATGTKEMFGWETGEVIGQHLSMLQPSDVHDVHQGYVDAFWTEGITDRDLGSVSQILRGLHRDGHEFEVQIHVVALRDGLMALVHPLLSDGMRHEPSVILNLYLDILRQEHRIRILEIKNGGGPSSTPEGFEKSIPFGYRNLLVSRRVTMGYGVFDAYLGYVPRKPGKILGFSAGLAKVLSSGFVTLEVELNGEMVGAPIVMTPPNQTGNITFATPVDYAADSPENPVVISVIATTNELRPHRAELSATVDVFSFV